MRTGIVAFLLGTICLLNWPLNFFLKQIGLVLFLICTFLVLLFILYKAKRYFVSSSPFILPIVIKKVMIFIFMFLSGFIYSLLYINELYPELDLEQIEGKTIEVKGIINSIPNQTDKKQSFDFYLTARKISTDKNSSVHKQSLVDEKWDNSFSGKIKLSWYRTDEKLENGQAWHLKIRLKRPNGFLNGSFDYEKWLYQNRILATGYVREGIILNPPLEATSFNQYMAHLRQSVSTRLDELLNNYPYKGLVKALAIGVRHDIEPHQWLAFLRTGTNHLIAISGLHIGLMSSLVWFVVFLIWRSVSFLNLKLPATYVASGAALLAAILYAALAGFAIPTQRALIMLSVIFISIMLKRDFLPTYILLFAALAVILYDPLSSLSPGFWLSFGAVAIILFTVSARLSVKKDTKDKLFQFGWIQVAIFIGLLPPLLILFHQFSLISPIANLVAVPLMSLLIVPMILLATILLFIIEPFALLIFKLLEWPISGLFWILDGLSQWSQSLIYLEEPTLLVSLMIFTGSLWLLMPKGWHGRWLGIILILPAFFIEAEKIPEGQIQLTVLDVGQGLAMVLRTRNHTLLYDTGDKYSEQFNMADKVIIPYLRSHGIHYVDKLIISHSDRDHAGSYSELIHQVPIATVLAGEPDKLSVKSSSNSGKNKINALLDDFYVDACFSGQQWQWDGVNFQVISPPNTPLAKKKNNRSCVIAITTASNKTILLTGDIEKRLEKQLLNSFPELKADIVQVPHHGSNTSSSSLFLKQLKPEIALFSFGYRNRFHHPSNKVVSRYKELKVKLYNTSNGAIDIKSNMTNNSFSVKEYRVEHQRLWHRKIQRF